MVVTAGIIYDIRCHGAPTEPFNYIQYKKTAVLFNVVNSLKPGLAVAFIVLNKRFKNTSSTLLRFLSGLWIERKRICTFFMLQHLVIIGLKFFFSIHHLASLTFTVCQWMSLRGESWVSLKLKLTNAIILIPEINNLDTLLLNPFV